MCIRDSSMGGDDEEKSRNNFLPKCAVVQTCKYTSGKSSLQRVIIQYVQNVPLIAEPIAPKDQ